MTAIQDLKVHAPLVIAEGAILIFVCSIMVLLRFYARRVSGSSLGLDDCTIALALVSLPSIHQPLLLQTGSHCAIAFCHRNGSHSDRRFERPPFLRDMRLIIFVETSLKGLGYAASEGDAGRGHPDANVVGIIFYSSGYATLTAIGWLARRAHSSTCARLHQTELPPSLPTRVYESRRPSIQLGELVHDCRRNRVDDRILLHIALPVRDQVQRILDQLGDGGG